MGRLLVVVFIVFASRVRLGSSINIDGSCPVDLYRCLQCLSRGSSDLERCQQLFFFVTYTNVNTYIVTLHAILTRRQEDGIIICESDSN